MNQALGIVEVIGFACAVNTSDVMVKTADVELIGIERAKGSGWLSVKVVGDVGAVNAAVESGQAIATEQGKLVSSLIIPRLADGLSDIWLKPGLDASVAATKKSVVAKRVTQPTETPVVEVKEAKEAKEAEKATPQLKDEKEKPVEEKTTPKTQENKKSRPKTSAKTKKQPKNKK